MTSTQSIPNNHREDKLFEAYGFYKVSNGLYKKYFGGQNISISQLPEQAAYSFAYVVNASFACEIAIKAFISLEDSLKIGHSLRVLYDNAEEEYRDKVESIFSSVYGLTKNELILTLNESSKVFEQWRYYYEHNRVSIPKYFHPMVEAICIAAFQYSQNIILYTQESK